MAQINNPLYDEYLRSEFTATILKSLKAFCAEDYRKYEAKNIIERWLMGSSNLVSHKCDPIFSEEIMDKSHSLNRLMVEEIIGKGILPKTRAEIYMAYVLQKVRDVTKTPSTSEHIVLPDFMKIATKHFDNYFTVTSLSNLSNLVLSNSVNGRIEKEAGKLSYAGFAQVISAERYNSLGKKDDAIMTCMLRYSSVVATSQQWQIPRAMYKVLVDKYDVTLEAFASPLNSQLILIPNKKMKFCSLFPDVDSVFGSVGRFMETSFSGLSVAVNPPYVLSVLELTVAKCIAECEMAECFGGKVRMFIMSAAWTDADFHQKLVKSKYTRCCVNLDKGQHFYEDPGEIDSTGLPKKITAKFRSIFCVMSFGFDDTDYSQITEAMASPNVNTWSNRKNLRGKAEQL